MICAVSREIVIDFPVFWLSANERFFIDKKCKKTCQFDIFG
jgi:hypothetical protein